MRVVFLTHNFPRRHGDVAGSFLLRLARALRDERIDVRVVAPAAAEAPAREVLDGVEVVRFRYAPRALETIAYTGNMAADVRASWSARLALGGMIAAGARALRRETTRWSADVVHAHWWFPAGLSAALPRATVGRPLVVTSHGSDIRLATAIGAARPLFARVARCARAYTYVSTWLRDEALRLSPDAAGDVSPMPVAVDLFAPPSPGAPRDGLLFVGRLNEQKGIVDLLRAAAMRRRADHLTIVGDGPLASTVRALAGSLGIADRVRWIATVTQPELAQLYREARALVVPSRGEGLGLVAVEALLSETPVIAYASGGLLDVVRDGETGALVAPGDDAALAAAMDAMCADETSARRLGEAGRRAALERFAPSAVARRYRDVYERVLRAP